MKSKITIKEYFEKGVFIVPEYQRGYKWSVKKTNEKESPLEYFIRSLKTACNNELEEYFIEAVTVVEENGKFILVDGQQRTTSLFLLFTFLEDNYELIEDKLEYDVRDDSHKWLNNLISNQKEQIKDEDVQDIFYFKEAISQITNNLEGIEKKVFSEFIKEKVFLLYNVIPKDKAMNTFMALNGLKAIMKDEELIKSDLLIKSSRIERKVIKDKEEQFALDWKINEDRGRLARNWDKWLYWWNQKEVKDFFGTGKNHPLYYLLITYFNIKTDNKKIKDFSFNNFKAQFIDNSQNAKQHFEGLRKLQKTFEDLYKDWERYNLLGLSFNTSIKKNNVLYFFINNREKIDDLRLYTKWALLGIEKKEILENDNDKFKEKRAELKSVLSDVNLFNSEGKEYAYLQLLRMNVLDMRNRKFDFEIFKSKSLEHICPQNPPEIDTEFINSKKEIDKKSNSINSIGNLVLLNGSANSSLSNNSYDVKKQLLFDKIKEGFLLPHTLKVFSKSFENTTESSDTKRLFDKEKYWQADDVIKNKNYFIDEFDNYYGK